MTDHANELRRSAKKLDGIHCTGDVTAVMHAAAAHIEKLERRLHGLEWDVTHWRANHAAEVHRARVLKERPDMPLERVEAYKQIGELLARVAELEAERAEREKQGPVTTVENRYNADGKSCHITDDLPAGMKLYAAPPVTAPVRLTDMQVVKLFQDFNERDGASHADLIQSTEAAVLRANGFDIQPAEGN